ncbi:hypothetical protein QQ056_11530 [Oscillatoria laete-virens NRMC-F 0139]|nr:hypothetical protein [Oscillatoria laete-virens NRMC-F 0139]
MKTTIEMPDTLFRRVKSVAAGRGMSLKQFVTDALKDKLSQKSTVTPPVRELPGFGAFGTGRKQREETRRIQRVVDEEFSKIDPTEWK